jgi:SAM-dependent methyltransferase
VAHELRFRKDLFRSTAEYYDNFRPRYPESLLDDLRARVRLTRDSRVLDLACGTGQIAFALAAHVGEVVAVDQEAEMVTYGARKAERLGVTNIHWRTGSAEEIALDGGFDLVAIGNAFQRLDRDAVARRMWPHVNARGCIALLWGGTPWRGDVPWQSVLQQTLERWMDVAEARDRVAPGWEEAMARDPHEAVLHRAGYAYEGTFEFATTQRWTTDSLIGFTYSTSFLNRAALGTHADAFERDLRSELARGGLTEPFEQRLTWEYELARRPA